jgi:8-oxo-dGTP pyrophosphatase MutT (NUDIX family)
MAYVGSYLWKLRQTVGHEMLLAPGASLLVLDSSDRVLLTRRADADVWCMPGGAAEVGGSFAATAVQELREETGLIVEESDLVGFACISRPDVHVLHYPNGDVTHCFAMWFLVRKWRGEISPGPDEVSDVRFFPLDELPSPLLRPTAHALELYATYRRTGTFQVS